MSKRITRKRKERIFKIIAGVTAIAAILFLLFGTKSIHVLLAIILAITNYFFIFGKKDRR